MKMSEIVARHLANYIIDNNLPVGAMLPIEKVMLDNLGVGRSTLREALRLLEAQGLLTIRYGPKGGPVVSDGVNEYLGNVLALALRKESATLKDILDARQAIESFLAERAASQISPEELDELKDSIELTKAALDDSSIFLAQNMRFHKGIARSARSPVLFLVFESINAVSTVPSAGLVWGRDWRSQGTKMHEHILKALAARDPIRAAQLMRDHRSAASAYLKRHYPELYRRPARFLG
jgi:DNA-binding FadR family transcriptional regulator